MRARLAPIAFVSLVMTAMLSGGTVRAQEVGYSAGASFRFVHPDPFLGEGMLGVSVYPDPVLLARVSVFFRNSSGHECSGSRGIGLPGTTIAPGLPLTGPFWVEPTLAYAILQPTAVTCASPLGADDIEVGVEWREIGPLEPSAVPGGAVSLSREAVATGLAGTDIAGAVDSFTGIALSVYAPAP